MIEILNGQIKQNLFSCQIPCCRQCSSTTWTKKARFSAKLNQAFHSMVYYDVYLCLKDPLSRICRQTCQRMINECIPHMRRCRHEPVDS